MTFVSFEMWVDFAPALMRSAYESSPDTYLWVARNYTVIPVVLFGAMIGTGVSFSPDLDEETS